jgi:hypothetical protein
MKTFYNKPQRACFDLVGSENRPYIPEIWATEALERLEESMVMARLVHRDFNGDVAEFGDVVNTRRPDDFDTKRKTDSDPITIQTAQSTNVRVPLDQWFSTAFTIKDGERSLSFQELVDRYVAPAAHSIARGIDRALLGRVHAYMVNRAGRLGKIDATNAGDFLLEVREVMNRNLAPLSGRRLVLAPGAETAFLKNDLFIAADSRGDDGTALEEARLGRIYGHDTFMGQNVNGILNGADTVSGTMDDPESAGTTGSMDVTISGYEVEPGEYVVIDGNDQPTFATAATASTNTTAVTLNEPLKFSTLAGANITVYKAANVDGGNDPNLSGDDYPAGWSKELRISAHGANLGPQVGQLISFGTGSSRHTYTVIEAQSVTTTVTNVLLDRPLDAQVDNTDEAFPGPTGSLNWVFVRNALALVNRPLALPPQASGVSSGVSTNAAQDLSMRVTMQYDIHNTGTVVHVDMLAGVAVLDERLAAVLLG